MAKRKTGTDGSTSRKADDRRFVQTATGLYSLGVEVTSGQPWIGVDQHVGHGSADALFALDDGYAAGMVDPTALGTYPSECWRGEHDDRLLFHPGGDRWRPGQWHPLRTRMLPRRVSGELWWHLDALAAVQNGAGADDEHVVLSRALAAGSTTVEGGAGEAASMTLSLSGADAYPRPAAVISGLDAGSDRARAVMVLGEPTAPDSYRVEGDLVRLQYVDDGLTAITLERPAPRPLPEGPIGTILRAVGTAEAGPEFAAVADLAGSGLRRWAASSGFPRRLLESDRGVELQVDRSGVLSVRVEVSPLSDPSFEGLDSRDGIAGLLGPPVDSLQGTDLYRFGAADLLVEYAPITLTAVRWATSVSHGMYRWRSGEFVLFLDVLGRPLDDPLVAQVRSLDGAGVLADRGIVTAVEVSTGRHRAERFAAFVDGMPARPSRSDLGLGSPAWFGDRDDLYAIGESFVHVHCGDGHEITSITVSDDAPRSPRLQPLTYGRRGEWPPGR